MSTLAGGDAVAKTSGGRASSPRVRRKPKWRDLSWWNSYAGLFTGIATIVGVVSALIAVAAWLAPQSPDAGAPTAGGARTQAGQGEPAESLGTFPRTRRLGLEFRQSGSSRALVEQRELVAGAPSYRNNVEVMRVALERQPFELLFPREDSRVGLHICAWRDSSIFVLDDGVKTEDVPFFTPGTGFAEDEYGSGTLELSNEGHNFKVGNRIAHYSQDLDKINISYLPYNGDVYLTIFVDKNQNEVVDYDEFEFVLLDVD